MQPIATIEDNIDHFYALISFLVILHPKNGGKLEFFFKIHKYLCYKYFCLLFKNRGISRVVLLEIPFLYKNVQIETIFEVIRGEC